MISTSDYPAIADNLLRYLDVLASEWRWMREHLVGEEIAAGAAAFGDSPRRFTVDLPDVAVTDADLADVPSALRPDALDRDREALAAVLPRMRFVVSPR
jgi:hypothetical protein